MGVSSAAFPFSTALGITRSKQRNLRPCGWFTQSTTLPSCPNCPAKRCPPFPSAFRSPSRPCAFVSRRRTSRRRRRNGRRFSTRCEITSPNIRPTPPLPFAELAEHADRVVQHLGIATIYRDYTGVLLSNELWRESLATVPFRTPSAADAEVPARGEQVPGAVR